jgi:ABC-type nickel/cobalt efflux system permease component RcnA
MTVDAPVMLGVIVAVLVLAAAAWFMWHTHNRQQLKQHFGPEYDRVVREYGSESKAESALAKRTERAHKYKIRPLSERERGEFQSSWQSTQARFVDDPRAAVKEADRLVCRLMETLGYPMTDFDRRTEDISVDHPHVVQNYRTAHAIAQADAQGKASTEDLRRAVVCYRALFADLLETQPTTTGREVHA